MKKTISSSIGGIVFNIEEDAHDKLSAYLNAISASLKDSEGHDEIMADIESRIAEILQQKLSSYKQVITLAEVDEVIGIMGKPEDFGTAAAGEKQQTYTYTSSQYGGSSGRRRVYRDTDDKVIFGVCSGLSHHFDIDPIWLRLAFGLSIFLGGFGLILYILLAIILPKARTAAEKLEMMGEAVDVNNIRKVIEDEMENIKKKVKDFGSEIRDGRGKDRAKEFGKDMGDFFSSAGQGAGNLFVAILKGILMVVSIAIAIVLSVLLIVFLVSLTSGFKVVHIDSGNHIFTNYSVHSFLDMLAVTGGMRTVLITGIFLFIGIPLLALIVRFGRAAAGRRRPFQAFTISSSILWAASWILLIIGISSVSSHFSVSDFTRTDIKLNTFQNKTLYVKVDNNGEEDNIFGLDSLNLYVSDEDEFRGNPSLCIDQSPDTNYHLILTKIARGVTKKEATDFADAIDYNFSSHDSTLMLDPYFSLEGNRGWRKQRLDLSLEVPLNKSIAMPLGIDKILCPVLHHKGRHIGGEKWTMTQTGLVQAAK
jgi:phage shock protein PspC (stress-responsive transcriptional regulator)